MNDKMPPEAPPRYCAASTSSMISERTWRAGTQLPTFLCPAGMLGKYDAVGSFLRAAFTPMEHHSCCLLQLSEVLFSRKIFELIAAAGMPELGLKADASKLWKDANQQVDSALAMVFMKDRRAYRFHCAYIILGGFAD